LTLTSVPHALSYMLSFKLLDFAELHVCILAKSVSIITW